MSLKELTWEHHKNAERQEFVKELMGGEITNERYATYLFNQHPAYNTLEMLGMMHGLFDGVPELRRAPRIHARRFRRYRQAIPMNYSSATRFTFLPFELEPLGFSPNGQLRSNC
jgi:hypothetical protein